MCPPRSLMRYIDAIEVFNSRTIFNFFNNKAFSFAEIHGIPMTVGSDSHFTSEMGGSFMLVQSEHDINSILAAILAGRSELIMRSQSRASRLGRGLRKLRSYF